MKWHTLVRSWYQKKKPSKLVITQCGNLQIFPPRFFCKNFVKSNILLKSYTVNQFDEKISQWGKISEIFTLWSTNCKIFSQFYLLRETNFFSNIMNRILITVNWFDEKMMSWLLFFNFNTTQFDNYRNLLPHFYEKISWNQRFD